MQRRTIFFISDSTGGTARTLGDSMLAQFEDIDVKKATIPYVRTMEDAQQAVQRISDAAQASPHRPIVFATLTQPNLRDLIKSAPALFLDVFNFIEQLEVEFGMKSSHGIGRNHEVKTPVYDKRMAAINYATQHDDGGCVTRYEEADVILIGVSRTSKTPTSIYLAMTFSVLAANYPLSEEDVMDMRLPESLQPYQKKLFGLTIDPQRLQEIRQSRRPNSRYSSLAQCQIEVQKIEAVFRLLNIPYLNTTRLSVEEIATLIVQKLKLESAERIY